MNSRSRHNAVAVGLSAVALVVGVSAAASAQSSSPTGTCVGPPPQTMTGIGTHDLGPGPTVLNIHAATISNTAFRDTYWTGSNLQLTVMSINRGDDIGLEMHPQLDQFLRIESGHGVAKLGPSKDNLPLVQRVNSNSAILIPAGTWHDVINTGHSPLKVYSIYAPPNHPRATLHQTKQDAANDPLEKLKCPQDEEAGPGQG